MRQGRTFKRCKVCARGVRSDQRRCPHKHPAGKDTDRERIVWAYQVDLNETGEARRQRQGSGYATRSAAVAAMREAQSHAESGEPEPTKMTTGQWLDQWLPSMKKTIRGGSWVGYELAVRRHIAPRLGRVPLRSVTRAQVKTLYSDLEDSGLSVKTVHNVHMILRRALGDAVEDGLIARNPADRAHSLPRGRRAEIKTWDGSQVRAFLLHVDGGPLAALWRLAATTGMRRGELLGLRWQDVDLDAGALSVTRARVRGADGWTFGEPKTKAGSRRIDLDPATVEALRVHRTRQVVVPLRDALVFTAAGGSPLDPDGVTGAFERLSRAAGLPRIRLHDLRHTAASLLLAAGVPAKVVQERLGHSSIVMTMDLYSHVAPSMQRDAAEAMARAIDG